MLLPSREIQAKEMRTIWGKSVLRLSSIMERCSWTTHADVSIRIPFNLLRLHNFKMLGFSLIFKSQVRTSNYQRANKAQRQVLDGLFIHWPHNHAQTGGCAYPV